MKCFRNVFIGAVMFVLLATLVEGCGPGKTELALKLEEGDSHTLRFDQDVTTDMEIMGQNIMVINI